MKFYFIRIFLHLFPKQPKTCITFMLLNHFKQGIRIKNLKFNEKHPILSSFIYWQEFLKVQLLDLQYQFVYTLRAKLKKDNQGLINKLLSIP